MSSKMSTGPIANLEAVKYINQRTKDVVNGYIKAVQTILPADNVYFNIPSLVSYWIMLYYYHREFLEYIGDRIKLDSSSTNAKMVDKTGNGKLAVHGHLVIDKNSCHSEYIWDIKLHKFEKTDFSVEIGLKDISDFHGAWSSYYFSWSGMKVNWGFYFEYGESKRWKEGDVIRLKLKIEQIKGVKQGTLESFINGVSSGVAFEDEQDLRIDQEEYRFSIKMPSLNDQVELVNFYTK